MVPALANIRTLRRLADCMQAKPARQLFKIVEVLADRGPGLQPLGFRLPQWRVDVDLHKLRCRTHAQIDFTCLRRQ